MSTKKQVKHTLLSRIADKVRGCDYYRVMPRELTEPTVTGASGNFLIVLVVFSQFGIYDSANANASNGIR